MCALVHSFYIAYIDAVLWELLPLPANVCADKLVFCKYKCPCEGVGIVLLMSC